ncbi:diguanylate cyclase [Rhodopirellula halodulae]|uniref:diguanylate cyclase n=1 Tax=Rhodopirellula halodulae TaxID=2894198 RepID=UPI001E313DB2|nr:diguanylate cyclase [Rhodopirellula sp. JC737]MCC9656618.1 diguanylate cyclase [Rhodopirellula sp. JC737]
MFKAVFASLRLAFALVCVGLGLILGAQWLGFIPDSRVAEEAARRKFCETVAIAAIDDIRHHRWSKLHTTLEALVRQNESLLSAGLRTDGGILQSATKHHRLCWKPTGSASGDPVANRADASAKTSNGRSDFDDVLFLSSDDSAAVSRASTDDVPSWVEPTNDSPRQPTAELDGEVIRLDIPITIQNRTWGSLEFTFRTPATGPLGTLLDQGILRLLIFFSVIGMGSYSFLMMRILGVFSRTQVVPERVRQALDTLAEGLLVLDEEGKIVLANDNFLDTNGFEPEELQDRLAGDLPWVISHDEDKPKEIELPWTRAINERQSVVGEILRLTGKDGVHRVFSVNAGSIGDDERQKGALVTFQDVTHVEKHRLELENMLSMLRLSKDEIQKKNQELEILATRDALTGCLNRRAFFERMETILVDYRNAGRPLSCFMVDVDHFKSVNDTYGHHTGDEVLRKVSKVLRDLHEENQVVCRYGGEEFCVMLPGHDLDEAMEQSERTRLAIMNIRLEDPESLRLTASLGVSELKFGATDVQELINQADGCLYVAKRGGRNQSVAYDPDRVDVLGEEEHTPEEIADPDLASLPFHAVTALVSALAYRDPATAEHSRRVANLCVKTAKGLVCQRDIYVLEIAALLHDIGKIGVPDDVLHKPGPLTEDEWKVMRRHNTIGLDMVAGTFHCPELERIIRAHHAVTERGDIERQLKLDDLPLEARILTIADTYDSIVSDHAYRRGRSHATAVRELERCAGKQFDAELVIHFLSKVETEVTESALGVPTAAGIAFAVPKPIALKIGQQIERIAEAMDAQNLEELRALARDLSEIADESYLTPIVDSAKQIEEAASPNEDIEWLTLLRQTQTLLDLCRATQNAHLIETDEQEEAFLE